MKLRPNPCAWGPNRVILNSSLKEMLKKSKETKIKNVWHPIEIYSREHKIIEFRYKYSSLNKISSHILCIKT